MLCLKNKWLHTTENMTYQMPIWRRVTNILFFSNLVILVTVKEIAIENIAGYTMRVEPSILSRFVSKGHIFKYV